MYLSMWEALQEAELHGAADRHFAYNQEMQCCQHGSPSAPAPQDAASSSFDVGAVKIVVIGVHVGLIFQSGLPNQASDELGKQCCTSQRLNRPVFPFSVSVSIVCTTRFVWVSHTVVKYL